MNNRFRVVGRLDVASWLQEGTVTISRTAGTFAVRPLRRRRDYVLPLSTVAEIVCQRIIRAELAERRAARKQHGHRAPGAAKAGAHNQKRLRCALNTSTSPARSSAPSTA